MKIGFYEVENTTSEKILNLVREAEKGNIFFRYQQPEYALVEGQVSWMCSYESAEEAEQDGNGYSIEKGKSCMADPLELYKRFQSDFSYDGCLVVAFEGKYIEEGSNGEEIAEFEKVAAVFSATEFDAYMGKVGDVVGKGKLWYAHDIYDVMNAIEKMEGLV